MNTEDFVTYEQAIKLKERGFNELCICYYDRSISRSRIIYANRELSAASCGDDEILCPSLSQAAKWLREVKGRFVDVWLCDGGYGWTIEKCGNLNCNGTLVAQHGDGVDDEDSGLFITYEKALSAGIDEALGLIKENA